MICYIFSYFCSVAPCFGYYSRLGPTRIDHKITLFDMKCPNCGTTVPDDYRFCTKCGTALSSSVQSDVPVTVKNKALWEIQPGEIARKISEADFVNLSTVSGIIVQPGVSAIVFIDGKEAAHVNAGVYNFIEDKEIKAEMDKRVEYSGVTGFVSKLWSGLVRFISGQKVNEPESINSTRRTVTEIISRLNANTVISVYLKRNTNFPAFFGSVDTPEGKKSFVPMKIRTRVLDAEIGVQMFLNIVDFNAFIGKYLLEKKSASFVDVQNDLSVYVRNILQEELRGEDIDDYGISQAAKDRISARLASISQYADGIGFVRVTEISCSNEDFDRFRKLTQELWCSEKELDFLQRTNEFQNRLARENNEKILADARNEFELKEGLRGINRDRLLSDDEFEAFASALALKKFHRATSAEIEQLSGQTELASAQISAQTRLALDKLSSDESIYARTIELEKQKVRDAREMNRAGLDIQRDNDDYADERKDKELAFTRRKLEMALDIDDRMNEQEQSNLDREEVRKRAAMEQQRTIIQDQLSHKERMADIQKDYSAEQIMASKISEMDAGAQSKFAESFSSKKEEEAAKATRQVYEDAMARQSQERKESMDFLKDIARSNAAVAGAQISKAEEHKNEYREDARYQQSRVDHTQDKALEYAARSTTPQKPAPKADEECPVCGAKMKKDEKFCPECGRKLS